MKTFSKLTKQEEERAIKFALRELVEDIYNQFVFNERDSRITEDLYTRIGSSLMGNGPVLSANERKQLILNEFGEELFPYALKLAIKKTYISPSEYESVRGVIL